VHLRPARMSEHRSRAGRAHGLYEKFLLCVTALAVATISVAVTTAMAAGTLASGKAKRKPISAAAAFILPSTKVCARGHKLTFRLRKLPHARWLSVMVSVNGQNFETIRLPQIPRPVNLTGLPSGT